MCFDFFGGAASFVSDALQFFDCDLTNGALSHLAVLTLHNVMAFFRVGRGLARLFVVCVCECSLSMMVNAEESSVAGTSGVDADVRAELILVIDGIVR